MSVSAVSYPLADCLSYGLKNLVVSLAIAPFAQCLGAAAQDVFEGSFLSFLMWVCLLCEQVEWAWAKAFDYFDS